MEEGADREIYILIKKNYEMERGTSEPKNSPLFACADIALSPVCM